MRTTASKASSAGRKLAKAVGVAALFAPFACGVFPGELTQGGSGGGTTASSSAATKSGADGGGGTKGVDCIVEAESGVSLCSGVTTCPGLLVDHDVYPHCGFRPGGARLELACSCNGAVCPLGTADTCDQAKKLLFGQTELMVCTQVAEGRCTSKGAPAPSATTSATCDRACAAECGGAPSCIKMCGC